MLPHMPPLLHCLSTSCIFNQTPSHPRRLYESIRATRFTPVCQKLDASQQTLNTFLSAASAERSHTRIVSRSGESTATRLTHILSRCSDPHLTSQRLRSAAAEPVNFTVLHPFYFWLRLRSEPIEVVNNRETSKNRRSTCIQGRERVMPRSCHVAAPRFVLCSFRLLAY